MGSGSEKVKDPVCQMLVVPDQNAINYQGMVFAFCSQQCKDRFLANPHLYIGVPGEWAPKQEGQEVLKRRRLRLDSPLSDTDAQQVTGQLRAMMGVCGGYCCGQADHHLRSAAGNGRADRGDAAAGRRSPGCGLGRAVATGLCPLPGGDRGGGPRGAGRSARAWRPSSWLKWIPSVSCFIGHGPRDHDATARPPHARLYGRASTCSNVADRTGNGRPAGIDFRWRVSGDHAAGSLVEGPAAQ